MANTASGNTGNNGNTVLFAAGTYQLTDAIGCTGASYEAGRTRVLGATGKPEDVVLRSSAARWSSTTTGSLSIAS